MDSINLRKDLIDYYKWVVTLATFVLTVSLSFLALKTTPISAKFLLYIGWVLLGCCIALNWLIVKSLVNLNVAENLSKSTQEIDQEIIDAIVLRMSSRTVIYGLLQNFSFLIGILFTVIGLLTNL